MPYNEVAANRQPKTTMPNSNNYFLFVKMFLRTNYLKEQLSFTNTTIYYSNATLKNAVRVERRVICLIEKMIISFYQYQLPYA